MNHALSVFYSFTSLVIFFALSHGVCQPQDKHIIFFKDKLYSNFSVDKPAAFLSSRSIARRTKQSISLITADLPVTQIYTDSLIAAGARILYTSRWLNAALVQADSEVYHQLQKFSFISPKTEKIRRLGIQANENLYQPFQRECYNNVYKVNFDGIAQLQMIGADQMHTQGNYGQGMLIAVLDAGFVNTDKLQIFEDLRNRKGIIASYNFINSTQNVFEYNGHGTQVLSILAANAPNTLIGIVPHADYLLLQTEDIGTETRLEEFYWTLGAEYADSAGADILNSSLGYNTFDNPSTNHRYQELNGHTTLITQAASQAARTGMIVCNSAGNEGTSAWQYINAPADADSILSIGSVGTDSVYAEFSSRGPTADGRIKPDLVALGNPARVTNLDGSIGNGIGTSFSCPMIAGLAAGLWKELPEKSSYQIIELLRSSGSNHLKPNNKIGYGIPNYTRASASAKEGKQNPQIFFNQEHAILIFKYFNDLPQNAEVFVYKSDSRLIYQQVVTIVNNTVELKESQIFTPGLYVIRIHTLSFTKIIKCLIY